MTGEARSREPVPLVHASVHDVPDVVALIGRVFTEYDLIYVPAGEVPDVLDFDHHYGTPYGAFWIARDGGRVIASVGVELHDHTTAELHRLYVDSEYRGRRLGEALVNVVAAWCREHGVTRLILWSDTRFTHAHALYERLGFTRMGERTTPDVNQSSEYGYERAVGAGDVIPKTSASSS